MATSRCRTLSRSQGGAEDNWQTENAFGWAMGRLDAVVQTVSRCRASQGSRGNRASVTE